MGLKISLKIFQKKICIVNTKIIEYIFIYIYISISVYYIDNRLYTYICICVDIYIYTYQSLPVVPRMGFLKPL